MMMMVVMHTNEPWWWWLMIWWWWWLVMMMMMTHDDSWWWLMMMMMCLMMMMMTYDDGDDDSWWRWWRWSLWQTGHWLDKARVSVQHFVKNGHFLLHSCSSNNLNKGCYQWSNHTAYFFFQYFLLEMSKLLEFSEYVWIRSFTSMPLRLLSAHRS